MNETLRRALMHARLSEEDVAAHLQVDPKTVRRWTEGRTPYLRHRWALSTLLGLDEADLWPHAAGSRPEEVRAIYPHSQSIPRKVWQEFFQSADREIDILADNEPFPADENGILGVLRGRAEAGVELLICLRVPDSLEAEHSAIEIQEALPRGGQPGHIGKVEIRLHDLNLQNLIYRADDELIVSQRAFAIPHSAAPALQLRGDTETGLMAMYLESFHRVWAESERLT